VGWRDHVRADPLPWLLEEQALAVRAAALQRLCGFSYDAAEVRAARSAVMHTWPIKRILDHQADAVVCSMWSVWSRSTGMDALTRTAPCRISCSQCWRK
jgi:hypothetical protein